MSDLKLPVLGEIEIPGSDIVSIDWSPDGTRFVVGRKNGDMTVVSSGGSTLWSQSDLLENHCYVRWSPDGRWIAVSGDNRRGIRDSTDGEWLWNKPENKRRLTEFDLEGQEIVSTALQSKEVLIELVLSGKVVSTFSDIEMFSRLSALSPDESTLAIGRTQNSIRGNTRIDLVDRLSGRVLHHLGGGNGWVYGLRWAPEGDRLACATGEAGESSRCFIVERGRFKIERDLSFSGPGAWTLDWAKQGDLIAIGSIRRGYAEVFRGCDGERLARCSMPGSSKYTSVVFSVDGRRLAIGNGPLIRIYDTSSIFRDTIFPAIPQPLREYAARQTATVGRRPSPSSQGDEPRAARRTRPAPSSDHLLRMVTALYRLDLTPPLSLLRQLDDLLTGRGPEEMLEDLGAHPGIQRLRRLRWPPTSRAGLIALLLRTVLLDDWRPPTGTGSTNLRDALDEALQGDEIPPHPEPLPGVLLRQAADGIDARVLTLLEMLGPDAVHDDPGLPLRLLPKAAALPPFARAQRHLLTADLHRDDDGRAQGQARGAGLAGIQRRGKPDALLPSQLALPPDVLAMRHLRGDLLYRAQTGGEPPRLRPTVILLDVSPPTFGPVEKMTRMAAMLVGRALLDAGLPAILLTAGGRSRFHVLDRRSQLLSCWTERSLEPVRTAEALRMAEALWETLRGGPVEPVVLLLSHAWFGAEEDLEVPSSVRALLVRYPGQPGEEPVGQRFGQLAMVGSNESGRLLRVLRELIG